MSEDERVRFSIMLKKSPIDGWNDMAVHERLLAREAATGVAIQGILNFLRENDVAFDESTLYEEQAFGFLFLDAPVSAEPVIVQAPQVELVTKDKEFKVQLLKKNR